MTNLMVANRNNLKNITKSEKKAFITILCMLASIDGTIRPEEIEYIEDLAKNMQIEVLPAFYTYPSKVGISKASLIKSRPLALELLKNMFALAYTDNTFSDSERHFICTISEALNIEPQKVSEISSWIIDRIIWLEQKALIFEENPINGGLS